MSILRFKERTTKRIKKEAPVQEIMPARGHTFLDLRQKVKERVPIIEFHFDELRPFVQSNKRALSIIAIVAVVLSSFGLLSHSSASVATFYPSTCLGGWQHPENAQGAPVLDSNAPLEQYSTANSALLSNSSAELYCGTFQGDIPKDTLPKKFVLNFDWSVDDGTVVHAEPQPFGSPETPAGTVVEGVNVPAVPTGPDSTTTAGTDALVPPSDAQSVTVTPDTTPAPTPDTSVPSDSAPQSLLNIFSPNKALADDAVPADAAPATTATTDTVSNDPGSLDTVTPAAPAAAADSSNTQTDSFATIAYTLDGAHWNTLGTVGISSWRQMSFELPLGAWDDLSHLQVSITPIQTFDHQPVVYLDAMQIGVEYEEDKPLQKPTVIIKNADAQVLDGKTDFTSDEAPSFAVVNPNLSTADIVDLVKQKKAEVLHDADGVLTPEATVADAPPSDPAKGTVLDTISTFLPSIPSPAPSVPAPDTTPDPVPASDTLDAPAPTAPPEVDVIEGDPPVPVPENSPAPSETPAAPDTTVSQFFKKNDKSTPTMAGLFSNSFSFFGPLVAHAAGGFIGGDAPTITGARVLDYYGNPTTIKASVDTVTRDGESTQGVTVEKPKNEFRAGRYTLEVTIETADVVIVSQQDFTWGVLAINTDKAVYTEGDSAYLQFGVLDTAGNTICDATLSVAVKTPSGTVTNFSSADGTIVRSGKCGKNNIVDVPDYSAHYAIPLESGTYVATFSATTGEGTKVVEDTFDVGHPNFDVVRTGPTRIFPFSGYNYPMTLDITSPSDWSGTVTEQIPSNFVISQPKRSQNYDSITTDGDVTTISWNVNLVAGKTTTIGYLFQGPMISPEFFLVGPLSFIDGSGTTVFAETRQWQIADDGSCSPTATSSWSTATWTAGCTGGGAPTSADTLVIPTGVVLTIDGNHTVAAVTINSPTSPNGITVNTGVALTVTGDIGYVANAATNNQTITMNGTGSITTGTITMNAPTNSGNSTVTCTTGTGTLTVNSTMSLTGNTSNTGKASLDMGLCTLVATGTPTLTGAVNGVGVASITSNGGPLTFSSGITFAGGANVVNAKLITTAATTVNIAGTITGAGTLSLFAGTLAKFTGTSAINAAFTTWNQIEIVSGTTTLGAAQTAVGLNVDSGAILAGSTFLTTLTCTGTGANGFTVGGTFSGSGGITISTGTCTIDGSGTVSNTGTLSINAATSFASTANITLQNATIAIAAAIVVTNNGTVTTTGASGITGGNAGSTWTNAANSTLNFGGSGAVMLATGTLSANASPNTVNYNFAGAQTCKGSSGTQTYVTLSFGGSGSKTCVTTTFTVTNLIVTGTASYTTAATLTLTGTLTVSGGTFTRGGFAFQVNGATNISSGSVLNGSATLGWTFGGLVTTTGTGIFDLSTTSGTVSLGGGLSSGGGTFKTGTGATTLTATQAFTGSVSMTIGAAISVPTGTILTLSDTATTTFSGAITMPTGSPNLVINNGLSATLTTTSLTFTTNSTVGGAQLVTLSANSRFSPTAITMPATTSTGTAKITSSGSGAVLTVSGATALTGSATASGGLTSIDFSGQDTGFTTGTLAITGGIAGDAKVIMGSGTLATTTTLTITQGAASGTFTALLDCSSSSGNVNVGTTTAVTVAGTTNASLSSARILMGTGTFTSGFISSGLATITGPTSGAAIASISIPASGTAVFKTGLTLAGTTIANAQLITTGAGVATIQLTGALTGAGTYSFVAGTIFQTSGVASFATAMTLPANATLNVLTGSTLTIGAVAFTVAGPTNVTGTLTNLTGATLKTFTGLITVKSGGTVTLITTATFAFNGGITIDQGAVAFTCSGGASFTATQAVATGVATSGTWPNVSFTGVTTINAGVTLSNTYARGATLAFSSLTISTGNTGMTLATGTLTTTSSTLSFTTNSTAGSAQLITLQGTASLNASNLTMPATTSTGTAKITSTGSGGTLGSTGTVALTGSSTASGGLTSIDFTGNNTTFNVGILSITGGSGGDVKVIMGSGTLTTTGTLSVTQTSTTGAFTALLDLSSSNGSLTTGTTTGVTVSGNTNASAATAKILMGTGTYTSTGLLTITGPASGAAVANVTLPASSTLLTGGITFSGTLLSSAQLVTTGAATIRLKGVMSGLGALTLDPATIFKTTGTSTFIAAYTLPNLTLDTNTLGVTTLSGNLTLTTAGGATGALVINPGMTLSKGAALTVGGPTTVNGSIVSTSTTAATFTGLVTVSSPSGTGGSFNLSGAATMTNFAGGITVNAGATAFNTGTGTATFTANQTIQGDGTIPLSIGGIAVINANVLVTDSYTGSSSIQTFGALTLTGGAITANTGLALADGTATTVTGAVSVGSNASAGAFTELITVSGTATITAGSFTLTSPTTTAAGASEGLIAVPSTSASGLISLGVTTISCNTTGTQFCGIDLSGSGATNALTVTTLGLTGSATDTAKVLMTSGTFTSTGLVTLTGGAATPSAVYTRTTGIMNIGAGWTFAATVANTQLNTGASTINLTGTMSGLGILSISSANFYTQGTAAINAAYTLPNLTVGQTTAGVTTSSIAGTVTITNNLTVTAGSTLTWGLASTNLTVSGTTSISGTISCPATANLCSGTKAFTGALTVASGGQFDLSAATTTFPTVTFANGILIDTGAVKFHTGTSATVSFITNSQTINNGIAGATIPLNFGATTITTGTITLTNSYQGSGGVVFQTLTLVSPTGSTYGYQANAGSNTTVTGLLLFNANAGAFVEDIVMSGSANITAGSLTMSAITSTTGGTETITADATSTGLLTVSGATLITGSSASGGGLASIDFSATGSTADVTFQGTLGLTGGTQAGGAKLIMNNSSSETATFNALVTLTGGTVGVASITSSGATLDFNAGLTFAVTLAQARLITTNSPTINLTGTMQGLGTLSLSSTTNFTTVDAATIGAAYTLPTLNVTVATSGVTTLGAFAITISGATTVGTGATLTNASSATIKTFAGLVTVNSTGIFDLSVATAPVVVFNGGITANGTTFHLGGMAWFTVTSAQTLQGSTNMVFDGGINISSPIVVTNNGTVTSNSTMNGTGGWTQGSTGVLHYAGSTLGITTLTATATGNIVDYTASGQTVKATTYDILNITNGVGSSGAANVPTGTAIVQSTLNISAATELDINGTLTLNSGSTISGADASTSTIQPQNTSTFNIGSTTITLINLDAHIAHNTVVYNSTGFAQTVYPATYDNLTIADTGQTATLGGNITVNSTLQITSGTLAGSSYTMTLAGTTGTLFTNSSTFTAGSSTVKFTGDGAPTLFSGTFTGGSSLNTLELAPALTTSRIYTGGAAVTTTNDVIIDPTGGGSATLTYNMGGVHTIGGTLTIQPAASTNATMSATASNYNLTADSIDIEARGTYSAQTLTTVTLTGTTGPVFINNGTFSAGTSTVKFTGDAALTMLSGTFTGGSSFYNLELAPALTGSHTYTGGAAVTATNNVTVDPTGGGSNVLTYSLGGAHVVSGRFKLQPAASTGATLDTTGSNYAVTANDLYVDTGGSATINGSTLTLTGTTGTLLTNTGTFTAGTGSTVVLSGNGSATFNSAGATVYNLTSSGTSTKSLGATLAINNNCTISAGTFNDAGFQITGNATGTLSVSSGTTLDIGTTGTATSFPLNFITANITLDPASTVVYNSTVAQTISSTPTYGNLQLSRASGTPTKTLGGNTVVNGSLAIDASNTLSTSGSNYSITMSGTSANSFTNNGTFTANSGTVTFSGTATQTITGTFTGGSAFYDLAITNTSGTNPSGAEVTGMVASVVFAGSATASHSYTITGSHARIQYNNGSTYTFANINWTGGSGAGNSIYFRNSVAGSGTWLLSVSGTQYLSYVDVSRSNATGGALVTAYGAGACIDNGNNSNWSFSGVQSLSFAIGSNTVGLGTLTPSSTGSGSTTISVSTNASSGFILTYLGGTLASGSHTIPAYASPSLSVTGTPGFGMNAADTPISNTSGTCVAATDYASSGSYTLNTSGTTTFVTASAPANCTITPTYVANVNTVTAAGAYTTGITYIVTGTF